MAALPSEDEAFVLGDAGEGEEVVGLALALVAMIAPVLYSGRADE